MKRKARRLVATSMAVLLGVMFLMPYTYTAAKTETENVQELEPGLTAAQEAGTARFAFVTTEASAEVQALAATNADGEITGDGVRLRSGPSSTSSILEVMYNGELVILRGLSNPNWPKIKRCKTSTVGYVSKKYVVFW